MGEIRNLTSSEAAAKIKEMAEDIRVCMFCTELTVLPIATRPMSVQEVDDQGNLWFISSGQSNKNFEILQDDRVQLIFSKTSDNHFLSIFGTATIYRDKSKIEEVWTPIAKAWFEQGQDDPNVTVIKVHPTDAYYWDTKEGKIVSVLKIAAAAITGGNTEDGSIEGKMIL
ncbi:MAG TPA: pyridoxamine 5'-phosphate oxidase family protein [Flavobacterium sp.]|jgi:general stress protein 26